MSSASARLRREGYRMCAIAPFFEPIVSVVCARVMLSARECTGRRFILKAGEMWRPANAALRRTSFQRGRVRAPRTQKEKPSAADSSRKSAMVRPSFARSEAACSQARRWGGQRCAVDGSLGMLSEFATAWAGGEDDLCHMARQHMLFHGRTSPANRPTNKHVQHNKTTNTCNLHACMHA